MVHQLCEQSEHLGWPKSREGRRKKKKKQEKEGTNIHENRQEANQKQKLVTLTGINATFATTEQLKKGLTVTAQCYLQPAHITHTTCLLGSDQSYFRFYMSGGFLIHLSTLFVLHPSCCP